MSGKTPDQMNKDELKLTTYQLNRLMTKLGKSGSSREGSYEDACHEVGRLQGIEQGLHYAERITRG